MFSQRVCLKLKINRLTCVLQLFLSFLVSDQSVFDSLCYIYIVYHVFVHMCAVASQRSTYTLKKFSKFLELWPWSSVLKINFEMLVSSYFTDYIYCQIKNLGGKNSINMWNTTYHQIKAAVPNMFDSGSSKTNTSLNFVYTTNISNNRAKIRKIRHI